jgi:hypothetical protein
MWKNITITRLRLYRFAPVLAIFSSTAKIPPEITYSAAGVLNINLLVDMDYLHKHLFVNRSLLKIVTIRAILLKLMAGKRCVDLLRGFIQI